MEEACSLFLFDMEESQIKMVEVVDVWVEEEDDIVAQAKLVRYEQ